ncbi:Integrase [Alloactinosynnema sp. L-07]|uniref:GntR family transcriptional regulator n=1 Tax=Alloactinosynnema sp. L-07 TaxID=1653480 RepID=UPI00065EF315|nr:tyrosine-type recombinase/integrase [Alloactinosynnema sp. L-07]CRK59173.1 Integrase [Alloactinosynnema sp. L-07]
MYSGVDVLTGAKLYLSEVIPAGPNASTMAEEAKWRLTQQVLENRQPRTNASLNHLISEHLKNSETEPKNKASLKAYAQKHIERSVGKLSYTELRTKPFEDFYADLRRCRDHCDPRTPIKHYTTDPHECTNRCTKHVCRGLRTWTIRKIHYLMSAACESAVRWGWIPANPLKAVKKPAAPEPDPQPPTADEAARIVMHAWNKGFGAFVWLAMTTGARRGELVALRWRNIKIYHTVLGKHECAKTGCEWTLVVRRAHGHDAGRTWEKDTKTHQRRHICLDPETVVVLSALREVCERNAELAGVALPQSAFVFSPDPDGQTAYTPPSMSQRYARWMKTLGIDSCLKNLRHYSATELITAGVDIRTVAGRLGHGGGGTTTLKVYSAWVQEADQRASRTLMTRMPNRPTVPLDVRPTSQQLSPWERIADDLNTSILAGKILAGEMLPPITQLAAQHSVAVGTVHRAIAFLSRCGVIEVSRGKRAVVLPVERPQLDAEAEATDQVHAVRLIEPKAERFSRSPVDTPTSTVAKPPVVQLELLELGRPIKRLTVQVDPTDVAALTKLMRSAVRRLGRLDLNIDDIEMAVYEPGASEPLTTVVMAA